MRARGPYFASCIGLAGLGAWVLTGDTLGVLALMFVLWLALTIMGWEARA